MITLNSKQDSNINATADNFDDKHPCYHADADRTKDSIKWTVGVKGSDDDKEHTFSIKRKDKVWEKVTAKDFAIKLIEKFKAEGKSGINKWLKSGCD